MRIRALSLILAVLMISSAVLAREEGQKPAEEKKPWVYTQGLSYLGTSGNTRNQNFGADFSFKRLPDPWGLEGGVSYMRGEQNGDKTAERIHVGIKGDRKLDTNWDWFLSGTLERDRFSGYDSRLTLATGAALKVIAGAKDELRFDTGLSWGADKYVIGANDSYVGGLLQMRYSHSWATSSKFQQNLLLVPNFDEGSKLHGESETAVITPLTEKLSFKGSFLVRYNNEPPVGFKNTDTTTALSLLYSF